ncbi:hypothetical protein [Streptomyces sp. FIT100]|uniref:hypothetical protein n=1 Tax=Streptomyces sp. FIT100 TaxID=2837956 RepID=UPI0021CA123E|nr:hypothetical protein [Streptomyces sp. FIT100]UUN30300.1 hypothetical protein KK483_31090 [Streptomyces sp. FIT100]
MPTPRGRRAAGPLPCSGPAGRPEQGVQVDLTYLERLLTDPESGITKPAAVFVEAERAAVVVGVTVDGARRA